MYLVAVCSCPVGIAHTYMAAANLKKAAQKKGIEIKVETQGAQGVEDEITAEDIARCDACIIASDVKIKGSSRFKDVPTMSFKVNEPIKDADAVIDELVDCGCWEDVSQVFCILSLRDLLQKVLRMRKWRIR